LVGRVLQNAARIHQIEHRRCDISVAARATPPKAPSGAASQCRLTGGDDHPDSFHHQHNKRPNAECGMLNAEWAGWSADFKANLKRTRETPVAPVSKPALPISNWPGVGKRRAFCGLETRDTADPEACATIGL
jgi:hypothetical protein